MEQPVLGIVLQDRTEIQKCFSPLQTEQPLLLHFFFSFFAVIRFEGNVSTGRNLFYDFSTNFRRYSDEYRLTYTSDSRNVFNEPFYFLKISFPVDPNDRKRSVYELRFAVTRKDFSARADVALSKGTSLFVTTLSFSKSHPLEKTERRSVL